MPLGAHLLDTPGDAEAVGARVGEVVGVAGEAAADELGQDGGAAGQRVLQLLQHHHACADQGLGLTSWGSGLQGKY